MSKVEENKTWKHKLNEFQTLTEDIAFSRAAKALIRDREFKRTLTRVDMKALAQGLRAFNQHIPDYNLYHRMERRLWSIKMGKGRISAKHEKLLKEGAPAALRSYLLAFKGISKCIDQFNESGFGLVMDRHLNKFTCFLGVKDHPLAAATTTYFNSIGCSTSMISEFHEKIKPAEYDLLRVFGRAKFQTLPHYLKEGLDAQTTLLNYTKENGLKYIRGRCGPPEWAVAVANFLASVFGVVINPWVIVVTVVAIIALLVALCATDNLPPIAGMRCTQFLAAPSIEIFRF